jgi:PAS domain S-box-containing protein
MPKSLYSISSLLDYYFPSPLSGNLIKGVLIMVNKKLRSKKIMRESFFPGFRERRERLIAKRNASKIILIVEDEKYLANVEASFLEIEGYKIVKAASGETALDIIQKNEQVIDLVLMDIDLGAGIDGIDTAHEILKIREIPILFLSSHTDESVVKKTEKITSYGYVVKCNGLAVLSASIKAALRLYESFITIKNQKTEIEEINEAMSSSIEDLEEMDDELLNNCAMLIDSEQKCRKSGRQYRDLFNNMIDGYVIHEIIHDTQGNPVDYRFVEVNPAFERIVGMSSEELVGKTVREVLPDTEPFWSNVYGRIALTGETITIDEFSTVFDHHYKITAYQPAPSQIASFFTEINFSSQTVPVNAKRFQEKQVPDDLSHLAVHYLNSTVTA